jgi:hypothetical protein
MTKEVTFKCRSNLIVDLYKEDDYGIELLNSHKLPSIESVNETNFKVSLTFEIHPVEIAKLIEAKYLYSKEISQTYTEKVQKSKPAESEK